MSERESAKVTEATDRLVEQLRAEERSNLDKIDSLRWKKTESFGEALKLKTAMPWRPQSSVTI